MHTHGYAKMLIGKSILKLRSQNVGPIKKTFRVHDDRKKKFIHVVTQRLQLLEEENIC